MPGLSVEKVRQLQDALGITSVAELKAAAEAGELRKLKGFGPKTEERLLAQISKPVKKQSAYIFIMRGACRTGARFPKTLDGVVEASVAGPLRRWEETVDAVDLVASSNDPEALVERSSYGLR